MDKILDGIIFPWGSIDNRKYKGKNSSGTVECDPNDRYKRIKSNNNGKKVSTSISAATKEKFKESYENSK